ncbi:MAG: Holliday junction resolvase RuvX [Thermoleophilaceae bacterium]|nr:Holliday junction resolvase RuvX [Thermoleophilaceae bacterium]
MRVLALDHGAARCGAAICDVTGELATPLAAIQNPDSRRGLDRVVEVVRERQAELVVVGLPLTLAGEEGAQAVEARSFAARLRERIVPVPVELWDERLTTRQAGRTGGATDLDSRAAAHLLEAWLDAHPSKVT